MIRIPTHCCILVLVLLSMAGSAAGADRVTLWHENRITPEQPFPARVVGVIPSWIDYTLLLEEMTGKEPRYCIARLRTIHEMNYTIVPDKKAFQDAHDFHKATYLEPAVPVSDFSWSIGAYTIGRRFGDKDFVAQHHPRSTKRGHDRERVSPAPVAANERTAEFLPREQRMVGVWKPAPGQERIAYEMLEFRADGTGTARVFKSTFAFEWDLVDDKLTLVRVDEMKIRTIPVVAITRNRLVIHKTPLYYRKPCRDVSSRPSDDAHATINDDHQAGQAADKSFGLANSLSRKLLEEQIQRIPKELRDAVELFAKQLVERGVKPDAKYTELLFEYIEQLVLETINPENTILHESSDPTRSR